MPELCSVIIIEGECIWIINENKRNACTFLKQVCLTDKHGDKNQTSNIRDLFHFAHWSKRFTRISFWTYFTQQWRLWVCVKGLIDNRREGTCVAIKLPLCCALRNVWDTRVTCTRAHMFSEWLWLVWVLLQKVPAAELLDDWRVIDVGPASAAWLMKCWSCCGDSSAFLSSLKTQKSCILSYGCWVRGIVDNSGVLSSLGPGEALFLPRWAAWLHSRTSTLCFACSFSAWQTVSTLRSSLLEICNNFKQASKCKIFIDAL